MGASRTRPKGVRPAPFGLLALTLIVIPMNGGDHDIGVIEARAAPAPRAAPERPRVAAIASPFGTIHAATFSFPRPIGSAIPEPVPVQLAAFTPGDPDVTGTLGERTGVAVRSHREAPAIDGTVFPTVNRTLKGDFLAALPPPDLSIETESAARPPSAQLPGGTPADDEIEAAARFVPFPEYDISLSLEMHPVVPGEELPDGPEADAAQPDISLLAIANDPDPQARTSRLFFGDLIGSSVTGIVPWVPGEEPILMVPRAPDRDMKRSAVAALPQVAPDGREAAPEAGGGETVAGKGEVTGEGLRPKSPAERLQLSGPARQRAEKCLANAVYFESRGESVRGQIAVAQVVLNRVFSGYYPGDVCGVVYQNAHRHLACQFTFACDGIPDAVTETEAWERATRVAKATLDGKIWLPEIGKATHYHAYWVHPWWVRTMRKLTRIGVHSFYRPRRWGDGDDAPSWGSTAAATEAAAKL
jgi:spore germination cell wall hydrolase CwlJ-like protein